MSEIYNQEQAVDIIINSLRSDTTQEYILKDLVRPNEEPEFFKKLELHYDNRRSSSIDDYLSSKNPLEMNFIRFFENFIPLSDSMNPHVKPYSQKEYFVEEIKQRRLNHLNKLDELLQKNNDTILNFKTTCQNGGGILHIGEKGSGKTFSQNVWLHENNDLLEENKIFWVRLDASKLMNIWEESVDLNNPNLTTIEEYFIGQMVFVFCKHFMEKFPMSSKLFVEIADKLSKSEINIIPDPKFSSKSEADESISAIDIFYFFAKKKGVDTLIDYLKMLERQIAIYEAYYKGENKRLESWERVHLAKSFLVDKVLLDSQKFSTDRYKGSKRDWMVIGDILKNFILANGYYLLYVVDGVDNVNYQHYKRKDFIGKILTGLYEFPLNHHNSHPNELILISLRDTTYESLKKIKDEKFYNDQQKYKNIEKFTKIWQDTIDLQKPAFDKRIEYVLKRLDCKDCFITKVIKTLLQYHNIPDESRWNSNIRCFMNNHLTLAKLITFRYYFLDKPYNFNIEEQIDTFENINYLLNGELYLDEQAKSPTSNKGHNLYNLFGYVESESNNPNYLIFTRLLQIIKRSPNISDSKLFLLTSIFDYNDDDVEICLDSLVWSGMIKSNYSPSVRNKIKFNITSKGEFSLRIFYNDIHYLYYSCLNTLLPETLVKNLEVSPNNFPNNSTDKKKYYAPYSIITGIQFLKHLINWNNYKLEMVKNKNIGIDIKSYKLPICLPDLRESVEKMMEICYKDKDYNEIMKDYIKKLL